jgi:hypothetical protein
MVGVKPVMLSPLTALTPMPRMMFPVPKAPDEKAPVPKPVAPPVGPPPSPPPLTELPLKANEVV